MRSKLEKRTITGLFQISYEIININREQDWWQYTALMDTTQDRKPVTKNIAPSDSTLQVTIPIFEK